MQIELNSLNTRAILFFECEIVFNFQPFTEHLGTMVNIMMPFFGNKKEGTGVYGDAAIAGMSIVSRV
ncbi:hypothetical protein, partial [Dubosiella newyorkensis]|uniref:hypothetical protein n=1 Tax=Dubosiella newyorkensis TaxID=1862672 RepID=UPI00272A6DBC